jgi:hypothetical protein
MDRSLYVHSPRAFGSGYDPGPVPLLGAPLAFGAGYDAYADGGYWCSDGCCGCGDGYDDDGCCECGRPGSCCGVYCW